jgi:succinate-semialdehyde dehydrogenase/glutarate-semialdehyde dehydrogenase
MALQSINPATGEIIKEFTTWDQQTLESALVDVSDAARNWREVPLAERCELLNKAARVLRDNSQDYARTISLEMGKLVKEAEAEIEKCAWVCEYYAEKAPEFLADELVETDASRSLISYLPLGTVLAVMPWNFPFWQVFRFAAAAIAAGNTVALKHASNVPQSALNIEAVFQQAGFPQGIFRTLMISASQVKAVIEDDRIHAVTLTGSEAAGRKVAETAGASMKKSVLELGGSDPFIVLADCDLEWTISQAIASRFGNCGQVCIAAKRFILVESIADQFVAAFKQAVENIKIGDQMDPDTQMGPMARLDLRDELHQQVQDTLAAGAVALTGCQPIEGPGAFYKPSILDQVKPGMRAYEEEIFGPVAMIVRVKDEAEAIKIANQSRYGLGSSIWSCDIEKAERLARQLNTGSTFINGLVKSDPRLPIGGVKASGYGRELTHLGIREFTNAKAIWIR